MEDHGHFKCTECNKIYDFELNVDGLCGNLIDDKFKVEEKCIYLKGICSDCI